MIFTSETFLFLFLPVFLLLYRFSNYKYKLALIICGSCLYYISSYWYFLFLVIFNITVTWLFAGLIFNNFDKKKIFLQLGILLNALPLLFYKYSIFFYDNLVYLLNLIGFSLLNHEQTSLNGMLLPLGISFFTFQGIGYLLDVYFGKIEKLATFREIFIFLLYFPKILSGPLIDFKPFKKELDLLNCSNEKLLDGALLLMMGIVKKSFLADNLSPIVTMVFDTHQLSGGVYYLLGIFAFTFQIYFDFSGYSDMAIGISKMLGINLPQNFNSPYKCSSITDFWARWHMSLSQWFKEYLYFSLAMFTMRRTKNKLLKLMPHFIVMVLIAFWHGASWMWLFFGSWHGIALLIDHGYFAKRKSLLIKRFRVGFAFLIYFLGFIFFRASTLKEAFEILLGLTKFNVPIQALALQLKQSGFDTMISFVFLVFSFVVVYLGPNSNEIIQTKTSSKIFLISFCFFFAMLELLSKSQLPFIYFQF